MVLRVVVLCVTEESFVVSNEVFAEVGHFASAHSVYEKLQLKEGLYSCGDGHSGLEVQTNYSPNITSSSLSINTGWSTHSLSWPCCWDVVLIWTNQFNQFL